MPNNKLGKRTNLDIDEVMDIVGETSASNTESFVTQDMIDDVQSGMIFQEFLKKHGYSYRVYNSIKKEDEQNG